MGRPGAAVRSITLGAAEAVVISAARRRLERTVANQVASVLEKLTDAGARRHGQRTRAASETQTSLALCSRGTRSSRGFVVAFLGVLLLPNAARADSFGWGGHVAYGGGGAIAQESGFRQNLDLALVMGKFVGTGSSGHMPGTASGTIVGASGVVGFGQYPSFTTLEVGRAQDNAFAAFAGTIGLALRVDPSVGGGLQARIHADLALINVGVRLIAIFGPNPEAQLCFTLGFGRY